MKYTILILLLFHNVCLSNSYNICVGSTGLLFSYTMGSLAYMKSHTNNVDYHLIGTSGGSWCSLIYLLENDISNHDNLWDNYIGERNLEIKLLNRDNMIQLQKSMQNGIKKRYENAKTTHLPLSIVTTKIVDKMNFENVIIDRFDDIDDTIQYSLCSSYIPYICGKKHYLEYKNERFIDGHLFRNEEMLSNNCQFNLDKTTWGREYRMSDGFFLNYEISSELFENGWKDTMRFLQN